MRIIRVLLDFKNTPFSDKRVIRNTSFTVGKWTVEPERDRISNGNDTLGLRPQVMELLLLFAKNAGQVISLEDITSHVWKGKHVTASSVYGGLNELRQALGDDSHDPSYIQTISKKGYRLIAAVTFPNPENLTAGEEPAALHGLTLPGRPRYLGSIATVGGLTILLLLALLFQFESPINTSQEPEREQQAKIPPKRSIAVLPFVDMSPDNSLAYFADGLSEEILNLLAQTNDLIVIARTSSFSFKGLNRDIGTIAQKLNVAHVLEGSIRKEDDTVRITAQLVDTASDAHLWSQSYDRKLDSVFSVQSEIAGAVAEVLKARLLGELATENAEAHTAYLRGRYLMAQRTQASISRAIQEFEIAVSLDPDFALAYAELSLATRRASFSGKVTRAEAIARAKPYAEKALALDPTLAQAHAAIAYASLTPDTLDTAIVHFRRAIELNPNYSEAHLWLGNYLGMSGHYDEFFIMQEKAVTLDPLSLPANVNYGVGLIQRNRLDEADRQIEIVTSIAPNYDGGLELIITRRSLDGHWADGLFAGLEAVQAGGQSVASPNLAYGFAVLGLEKEALALFDTPRPLVFMLLGKPVEEIGVTRKRYLEDPDRLLSRLYYGMALADAGDYSNARPLLEKAWQQNQGLVTDSLFTADAALALLAIHREAGEDATAGPLQTAIKDNVRRYHAAGVTRGELFWSVTFEEGISAFLEGDRDRGLALIARAVEDGNYIRPNAAWLQMLYDDPGFTQVLATQKARQESEREKFLAVVCMDNPYADFWQPAHGTCERY